MAADLSKFIFRLEIFLNLLNSLIRFGRDITGLVRENRRSSAYAEILYWPCSIVIPVISGFFRICIKMVLKLGQRAEETVDSFASCR